MSKDKDQANIALCYVRLSRTINPDEENSPERQRGNIRIWCERHGWEMEWYEDVGGHKSGTSEKNRPAWLQLKQRLGDKDVVALVANDMSRIHRKGWRTSKLLDDIQRWQIKLVLAGKGREIDTSVPEGLIT
ncbi:MAG: recombinase family protein, partial [Chloroflexota bacterium]